MREIGGIWRSSFDSLHVYTDEYMKLAKAQEKFKSINLTPAENAKAFDAVKKTVGEVKGLRLDEMTETITDLHTAFGDLEHAIGNLAVAGKYRFAFETLFGDKFNSQQIEEQIQNAFKYLEVTGAVAKGEEEMNRRFNAMAQITAATGGRVTPADMLQVARRGGPAVQGLSVQGMRNLATLVPELGGEGAGTALMSMYQALIGGVMKQSAAAEFVRLGLVDPKKIEYGKAQKIKKLLPGANKLGALMQEDPLKAADELIKAMQKPLKGKAIDTANADKVREELAILFGNRTAQKMMSILTTQRGQVVKEARIAEQAKEIQQLYDQALDSPMGKMKQFENAWANLQAEIGGPMVKSLTDIAKAAMPVVQFLAQHPKLTLWTLLLTKLGSAAAQTAGILKMYGVLNLFGGSTSSIGRGIAQGATGALTKAEAEAMLFGSRAGAAAAGSSLGVTIGGGIVAGVALAGIGMAISAGMQDSEAREEAAAAGEALGKLFAARFKAELKGVNALKEFDKQAAPEIAKNILNELQVGKVANDPISAFFGAKGTPFGELQMALREYSVAQGVDKESTASYIKSKLYASGIASPEVLSQFLQQASERLQKAGFGELYAPLQKLAAETFPQFEAIKNQEAEATKAAMLGVRGLGDAALVASGSLRGIGSPFSLPLVGGMPAAVGKTGGLFPKREFNLPSKASGGRVLGDGFVKVHAGEDIVPANVTKKFQANLNQRTNAKDFHVHVHNHIGGEVGADTIAKIEAATRRAVMQSKNEILGMISENFRDRLLAT